MKPSSRTRIVAGAATALLAVVGVPGDALRPPPTALAGPRVGRIVGGEHTIRLENVEFSYTGVPEEYARAMARVVVAARSAAIEQFGFDMPETLHVAVIIVPKVVRGRGAAQWTDGRDHIGLMLFSEESLRKPATSRPHTGLYFGPCPISWLCKQVGTVAMYRAIPNRGWMTETARLGWAEYIGARLLDNVYAREGKDLWPDPYDYREFGMKRLGKLFSYSPASVKGPALWKELVEIVGDEGVAPIFHAWGEATLDPANPGEALGKALTATATDKRVSKWWKQAQQEFVQKLPQGGPTGPTTG